MSYIYIFQTFSKTILSRHFEIDSYFRGDFRTTRLLYSGKVGSSNEIMARKNANYKGVHSKKSYQKYLTK